MLIDNENDCQFQLWVAVGIEVMRHGWAIMLN